MSLTFQQIFDRLIGHEGGYVNDPRDPGGETNWGLQNTRHGKMAMWAQCVR
ncbi:Predicted lysozyme (DUF847) [Rodentibacter pneumotropicus]|uniref:Predicted lysozyme (DUF847) n=1 Tax=Rodentibacter pneumotropicus TaxID=758 RepID=A0A3S4U0S0_9PAST|nr:Predicted lysozyme (DUF847) [Rodentibacter pneumotropicus]